MTPGINVLIADDNAINRKLLRVLLEAEGHRIVEADNGVAALKVLEHHNIDAVVSDVLMPEMDGFRLCYEIRKHARFKTLPFIVYTASYTSALDEKVALQFGVDRFIRKPASSAEILKNLLEVTSDKAQRRTDLGVFEETSVMRQYSEVLVQKLEQTLAELSATNVVLEERARLAECSSAVTAALVRAGDLPDLLQSCTDAIVRHLNMSIARIWTLNRSRNALELRARSGHSTFVHEDYSQIPLGWSEIGRIASERQAYFSDSVVGDARIECQEWVKSEGLVAFAGYPMVIADQLVGVMAVFARQPISPNSRDLLMSVAQTIGVGIQRQLTEGELRGSEERFRELAENINEIFFVAEPNGGPVQYVSPAYETITGRKRAALYQNPGAWLDSIHPDDRTRVAQAFRDNTNNLDEEYRIVRPDDDVRWLRSRAFSVKDESGVVVRIVGIAADITGRKHAEEKIQQSMSRIRALHDIDVAITSTLDLRTVLEVLLQKIEIFFPFPTVTNVRLLNRKTGEFEVLACHNIDKSKWMNRFKIASGKRAYRVLDTKRPLIVRDVLTETDPTNLSLYKINGLVSYIGIPLVAKDNALGVLNLYTKKEHDFDEEEVEFLTTLAAQAAIAIDNAQLYEETVRRRCEAEELARVARSLTETLDIQAVGDRIVSSIRDLFGVRGAMLRLLQPDGSFRRLASSGEVFFPGPAENTVPPGMGLTNRAVTEGRSIWSANVLDDPDIHLSEPMRDYQIRSGNHSMVAVPLRAQDKTIGALTLSDSIGRTYSDAEIALLNTFADQAALALENARLYDHTHRQLTRIQSVSEINNAITSTLSLGNVLHVLLEKIELVCPIALACGVRLFDEATEKMVPLASRHIPFEEWRREVASAKGRLTKLLIETRKPVVIRDMHRDSRTSMNNFARRHGLISYLGVPLVVRDKFIGNLVIYTKETHDFSAEEIGFFTNLGSQAAIAIHNARLYEDARAREIQLNDSNRMLSALHAVGAATSQSLDIDQILKSAIEKITEIFGFDATRIHIYDPAIDELSLRAHFEIDTARFMTARSFKKGQGIVGRVAESGEPLIFDDVQTDRRYQQMSRLKTSAQYGYHFFAVLPIKGWRETFGTLACVGNDVRRLSEAETQTLEGIAGQIAIALENSSLYQDVRDKVNELEQANTALQDTNRMLSALHAVAAAANQTLDLDRVMDAAIGKITEIFNFDATRIHLLDAVSNQLVRRASYEKNPDRATPPKPFNLGEGIIGRVGASGQAMVFEDIEADSRYRELSRSKSFVQFKDRFLGVFPVRSTSGIVGVLACLGHEARKLSAAEKQLLEAITDQVAVAIENARLFEKNESSRRELEATNSFLDKSLGQLTSLYTAMTPLAIAESLGEMVSGIMERLVEATGADASLIRILDNSGYPIVGQRGYSEEFVEYLKRGDFGGAIDWVMKNGEPIIAPDIASESRFRGKMQLKMGFRSCAILPLRVHDEVHGVIQLSSRRASYFDQEQSYHLMAVARQMSVALENRELFDNLQKSRNELEGANKVKDEFLSVMSHELRTPLSVVIGYSGMLRQAQLGPITNDQEQALEVIGRNSQELFTMIESIMDATKIESGLMIAEKDLIWPIELLDEIKVAYDFPLEKNIRIDWNLPQALPALWTDSRKLRQVLTNLINNAIKFTEAGGVVITAREKAGSDASGERKWIEFEVADSGVGIPPQECEKIFNRFHQVDSSQSRRFEGVGLGLYIVKSFTEMLGGQVSVRSELGKGSAFTVRLPVTAII